MNHDYTVRSSKAFVSFVILVLACTSTAGGGWVEDRDGKTVIHLKLAPVVFPNPNSTDTYTRAELAAVREFQRRFPQIFAERLRDKYKANPKKYGEHNWDNVEIELHLFSGIYVEGVETDLLAIAGGMAPDVLYINFNKSANYIQNGFLYPLDKPEDGYLSSMSQEEIDFRIHSKIWPVIRRKGPGGKKHVWAIPFGGALGRVLIYRKDLFDAKGIAYPTAQWTWNDLLDTCKKMADPKKGIYGMMVFTGSYSWINFLWSAGGEAMTYDEEKDQWRCVFDSHEAAVALEFFNRLRNEKWIDNEGKTRRGYTYKDVSPGIKWERGEIGMVLNYIDEKIFSTINPEVTGMVPVPLGPTGKRGAELNSRMMGLFGGIESPVVRDAAWEYIRFYDCKDAARIKTRIMVEGGLGKFINPKYLRMFGYPEIERLAPKGWSETFEIAIATGKPEPYGPNSQFAYNMMDIPIFEAEQMALADQLPEDYEARLKVLRGLLRSANARANEKMIGIISPRERRIRDITATGVLIVIVAAFAFVFHKVIRTFSPPKTDGLDLKQAKWGFRKYAWAYVLLLPAVLTILVWSYAPLVQGSVMAFQNYRLMGDSTWVWVRNFGDLLWDNDWWASVWNTMRYSFLVISLTFLPPIVLAILLQEVPRGRLVFRTIFYLPAVISGLVMIILWKQFFGPSDDGFLNSLVLRIPAIGFLIFGVLLLVIPLIFAQRLWHHNLRLWAGVSLLVGVLLLLACWDIAYPILVRGRETFMQCLPHLWTRLFEVTPEAYRWLQDPETAMLACVLPMVWAGMGPGCLIYLAALKGIPDELYEAADVDGATFTDKVLFVVFPILKPLILINFIGVFIGSCYAAGNILVMTGGVTSTNTMVAGLHIWYEAFVFMRFGPATAMAWVLAVMLIGFTVYQLRILSRLEFRTTGDKE